MAKTGKNFRPGKLHRKLVWALSIAGIAQDEIARTLNIDAKTLRKWFPDELDASKNRLIAMAVGVLEKHLLKNDRTTAFFVLKALADWRDQGPTNEQARLNLEAIDQHIARLRQTLGVGPGDTPGHGGNAVETGRASKPTSH